MKAQDLTIKEWTDALASSAPAPGGGGAAALLACLSACLSSMVGQLTVDKKACEAFSQDCALLNEKSGQLKDHLLLLIDEDASAFQDLMKAWKSGASDQDYARACDPARKIVFDVIEVLDLLTVLHEKGNRNVLSDVGVGAVCAAAALEACRINLLVNLRSMRSLDSRKEFEILLETLIPDGIRQAGRISKQVEQELR